MNILALMRLYLQAVCFLIAGIFLSPHHLQAQLTTFGEFSINAGRYTESFGAKSTLIIAAGTFGIQYSIVAINIGAGPVLFIRDQKQGRSLWDEIGIDFPLGLMLRIPLRNDLLTAGCDYSLNGYAPHAGILFPGAWNFRGFYLKAVFPYKSDAPHYFGIGLKMTVSRR